MHLRKNTVRIKGKIYIYAQLVESYRRPSDQMPAIRVVANLGKISELQYTNFQRAIDASRNGNALVVKEQMVTDAVVFSKPSENLSYLDITVLYELWKEWGLDAIFKSLTAKNASEVDVEKVVAALVIHRCIDPGSKLSTTRWFSCTALPELLNVKLKAFNNARVHRALEVVETLNASLMSRLPGLYQNRTGAFASLFLDVTDTWFVGRGTELAKTGKTKEGLTRRKIGIVLLVNEDGFPLRWDVVNGTSNDSKTMTAMLESIKDLTWLENAPLVCDRSMGKTAQLVAMSKMGINFLTAVTRTEYSTYATNLPSVVVGDLIINSLDKKELVKAAQIKAGELNLQRLDDDLFFIDFGLKTIDIIQKSNSSSGTSGDIDYVARAMGLCREIIQLVADKKFSSFRAAAASLGIAKGLANRYMRLRHLPSYIQNAVISEEVYVSSIDDLIKLTKLKSPEEIEKKFKEITQKKSKRVFHAKPRSDDISKFVLTVRVVAYFNPDMFAEKKLKAKRILARAEAFEGDLNSRLSTHGSRRSVEKIRAEIERFLHKEGIVDAFNITISDVTIGDKKSYRTSLTLNKDEWQKRGRHDGFCVLASAPKNKLAAEKLCRLYREKNTVELDFKTIKSELEIRPMYHQTDQKVSAHVTVCMLSLLLERTLRKRLAKLGTAQWALEELKACHLNRYETGDQNFYTTTKTNDEQHKIITHLKMTQLVDDALIAEKIMPRK